MSAGASLGAEMASKIDVSKLETPCFVTDLGALEQNLQTLKAVADEANVKILLALKGFAQWSTFDLVKKYLVGATASSTAEARLAREELGGEVHCYAPAYTKAEMEEMITLCDHIVVNSPRQWAQLRPLVAAANKSGITQKHISCGLRVNHEHREVEVDLYDPAGACSRMGTTRVNIQPGDLEGLEGLHFHTLCQKGSDALERALIAFEAKFAEFFPRLQWVNFGGGHHITRPDYDRAHLVALLKGFKARHPHLTVYLEPGEAVALGAGVLVSTVLDTFHNGMDLAILDTSATAHMPDVLEMPYRPMIIRPGSTEMAGEPAGPGAKKYTVRLGGLTCLSGDVIGDYSFDAPLAIGDKLIFLDMAHYTMVKTSTFNGVRLPSIATHSPKTGQITVHKKFGYTDYKNRLS